MRKKRVQNIPANVSNVMANEMKPMTVDAKLIGAKPCGMAPLNIPSF